MLFFLFKISIRHLFINSLVDSEKLLLYISIINSQLWQLLLPLNGQVYIDIVFNTTAQMCIGRCVQCLGNYVIEQTVHKLVDECVPFYCFIDCW